jgi:hypothetical protein
MSFVGVTSSDGLRSAVHQSQHTGGWRMDARLAGHGHQPDGRLGVRVGLGCEDGRDGLSLCLEPGRGVVSISASQSL